jgi:hypothetical protein
MFALVDIRDREPACPQALEPVAAAAGASGVSRGAAAWHKLWRS